MTHIYMYICIYSSTKDFCSKAFIVLSWVGFLRCVLALSAMPRRARVTKATKSVSELGIRLEICLKVRPI